MASRIATAAALLALCLVGTAQAAHNTKLLPSDFKVLIRSGDVCTGCGKEGADVPFGGVYREDRVTPITDSSGTPIISNNPDFTSLLTVEGDKTRLQACTHFESPTPSELYFTEVKVAEDGELSWTKFTPVDFREYGGVVNPCAGSVTPWNTHLGSEEATVNARTYERVYSAPNATAVAAAAGSGVINQVTQYFGIAAQNLTSEVLTSVYNPYKYGHITEVKGNPDGSHTARKVYTLGRMNSELPYVMPDSKTVYLNEDATNGGWYKFIADTPGNLDAGTMYAAKLTQDPATIDERIGKFSIEWIEMARGTQDELFAAAKTARFSDMFEYEAPNGPLPSPAECKANPAGCQLGCPTAGFKEVNTDLGRECLKLKPGMEVLATFLETRRMTSYVGGTNQLSKLEGATFDPATNKMYNAISYLRTGMENYGNTGNPSNTYDAGNPNDVKLDYEKCGCIFISDLDSSYSAMNFYTTENLCGKSIYDNGTFVGCDETHFANHDNISFMKGHAAMALGEDGDDHIRNYAWIWDQATGDITNIGASPEGAEVTGAYWHNLQSSVGFAYLGRSDQHPDLPVRAPVGYYGPYSAADLPDGLPIAYVDVSAQEVCKATTKGRGLSVIRTATTSADAAGACAALGLGVAKVQVNNKEAVTFALRQCLGFDGGLPAWVATAPGFTTSTPSRVYFQASGPSDKSGVAVLAPEPTALELAVVCGAVESVPATPEPTPEPTAEPPTGCAGTTPETAGYVVFPQTVVRAEAEAFCASTGGALAPVSAKAQKAVKAVLAQCDVAAAWVATAPGFTTPARCVYYNGAAGKGFGISTKYEDPAVCGIPHATLCTG